MSNRPLALFDFDGTITTRDTLFDFILYDKGFWRFAAGMTFLMPVLLAFKLKIISNWKAKEIVLSHFFKGTSMEEFDRRGKRFAAERLPKIIRQGAAEAIQKHIQDGAKVVIVSASAENWIRGWAESQGLELLATQLEVVDQRLTGRICGKNCNGDEKVDRIRKYLKIEEWAEIYAYGDSPGDIPMLTLATYPHYKPFR